MAGKVSRPFAVGETGAIVDVAVSPGFPREVHVKSGVKGVPLVVIQKKPSPGRGEIRESAADGAKALCVLVRVGKVDLAALHKPRRAQRRLSAAYSRAIDGEGKEYIGLAHAVVVKEIAGARPELVSVKSPSLERNPYSKLVFFVAFPRQWDERKTLLKCKVQERA